MSDRIYTISERSVVAGVMFYFDDEWRLVKARNGDMVHLQTFCGEDCGHLWFTLDPAKSYGVMLPGPSPRELLCSCNEWQLGQGADNAGLPASVPCGNWSTMVPPVHHADDCPVCRLRLRLWPVGATWQRLEDGAAYEVTVSGNRHLVEPHEIEAWCEVAPDMRAAFCEPEVQP